MAGISLNEPIHEFISVVVPVLNAEDHIASCIESLLQLNYPKDKIEILIVDNGSNDRSEEIIAKYPVFTLSENHPGAGAARNAGVARSHGSIIAFTDADCVVEPNWASAINRTLNDSAIAAVIGFTKGINENFWADLEQANFEEFWFRKENGRYFLRREGIDTRNAAIRKAVFTACGGFDVALRYCEDLGLSVDLRTGKHKATFCSEMVVAHHNRTRFRHILALKERHGRSYGLIVAAQPQGVHSPHLVIDVRKFFWIDNEAVAGIHGFISERILKILEVLLIITLQVLAAARPNAHGLALKLFKTACAIRWQRALMHFFRNQPS